MNIHRKGYALSLNGALAAIATSFVTLIFVSWTFFWFVSMIDAAEWTPKYLRTADTSGQIIDLRNTKDGNILRVRFNDLTTDLLVSQSEFAQLTKLQTQGGRLIIRYEPGNELNARVLLDNTSVEETRAKIDAIRKLLFYSVAVLFGAALAFAVDYFGNLGVIFTKLPPKPRNDWEN